MTSSPILGTEGTKRNLGEVNEVLAKVMSDLHAWSNKTLVTSHGSWKNLDLGLRN